MICRWFRRRRIFALCFPILLLVSSPYSISESLPSELKSSLQSGDIQQRDKDGKHISPQRLIQSYHEVDADLSIRLKLLEDDNLIPKPSNEAGKVIRVVNLNLDALIVNDQGQDVIDCKPNPLGESIGVHFIFNPKNEISYEFVTRRRNETRDGGYTLSAALEGRSGTSLTLLFNYFGDLVYGSFNSGRYKYQIRQIPGTVFHVIVEVDGTKLRRRD